MSGTRTISTTSIRELSSSFFFPLLGKAPKEIDAILSETLACFLLGRAKELSAPLYKDMYFTLCDFVFGSMVKMDLLNDRYVS